YTARVRISEAEVDHLSHWFWPTPTIFFTWLRRSIQNLLLCLLIIFQQFNGVLNLFRVIAECNSLIGILFADHFEGLILVEVIIKYFLLLVDLLLYLRNSLVYIKVSHALLNAGGFLR